MHISYEEIIKEIKECKAQQDNRIASIAFRLIQADSEKAGDIFAEAMQLRESFIEVQNAFEEEFNVLMGGEGNTYTAGE